ncbi:ABC transporter substrate-binding protein [Nocardioidaceae bacterium]|nr:ABC transporter substrate-binding protein [Nocardioidaceae bacterium]
MALTLLRPSSLAALAAAAVLTLGGCAADDLGSGSGGSGGSGGGSEDSSQPGEGVTVNLSGQAFDEAALVAAMYTDLLEDAGFTVEANLVQSRDVYMADFPGRIDVVPEYSGGIANFLNARENGDDAEPITDSETQAMIAELGPLAQQAGLSVLDPSDAADTNAYFVTEEYANQNDLRTLSDLADVDGPITLAAAPDCEGRADCEGGLSDTYGIEIDQVLPLGFASQQTYEAVSSGEAELGQTATTDGSLDAQGFVLLEDDQGIQPAQNLVPIVSTEFLEANPAIEEILNPLMAALTTDKLAELNNRVSVDRETPEAVSEDFLQSEGLLD